MFSDNFAKYLPFIDDDVKGSRNWLIKFLEVKNRGHLFKGIRVCASWLFFQLLKRSSKTVLTLIEL